MTIKLLIPDMPVADELLPFLRRIDSNRHYTNYGPLNAELEIAIKPYLLPQFVQNDPGLHITTIANATLGLEVVFQALNLPKHAKVLVPALTFPATATAVVRQNLNPVFADVDHNNWLLTPEIAREAIKQHPGIRLVVPVAAFGVPVATTEWDQFVDETGIPVVIDAAGAFGNQLAGSKVHIVFSLHATKALGGGEGGFIATRDEALHKYIRILSNFGLNPDFDNNIIDIGTNSKMSEYHAAVTLAALVRWPERQALRHRLLREWLRELAPLMMVGKVVAQAGVGQFAVTLLPLNFPGIGCAGRLAALLQQKNIQTRRWYYPLVPHHPGFAQYQIAGNLTYAERISKELLGMPFHLDLNANNIRYMVDTLHELLVPAPEAMAD